MKPFPILTPEKNGCERVTEGTGADMTNGMLYYLRMVYIEQRIWPQQSRWSHVSKDPYRIMLWTGLRGAWWVQVGEGGHEWQVSTCEVGGRGPGAISSSTRSDGRAAGFSYPFISRIVCFQDSLWQSRFQTCLYFPSFSLVAHCQLKPNATVNNKKKIKNYYQFLFN